MVSVAVLGISVIGMVVVVYVMVVNYAIPVIGMKSVLEMASVIVEI